MIKISYYICLSIVLMCCKASKDKPTIGCKLKPPFSQQDYGIEEDLLSYLKENNLYGKKFSTTGPTAKFRYDFCVCGAAVDEFPRASLVRVNIVQSDSNVAIGRFNSTRVSGVKDEWVMMNFDSGDIDSEATGGCKEKNVSLSSSVMIICDRQNHNGQFKLVYNDAQYCSFLFELRIASVCGPAPGMSGWTVLLIIILVALLLYFLIGFLYLRFHVGAKGVEQIPHRTLWFGLGDKIADCFSVMCRCSQYCSNSIERLDDAPAPPYYGGYSPIGEGAPKGSVTPSTSMDSDTRLLRP